MFEKKKSGVVVLQVFKSGAMPASRLAEGLELLELGSGSLEAREDGEYVEWAGLKLPRPGGSASGPPAVLQQALLKMARGPEFDQTRYGTQVRLACPPLPRPGGRACNLASRTS